MKNFLFLILFLLSFSESADTQYGAILIRDKQGDSLAIDTNGNLTVTTVSSGDTAVVQLNGDTIPVEITNDTTNARVRILNDTLDSRVRITNDTVPTVSRILNDTVPTVSRVYNTVLMYLVDPEGDTARIDASTGTMQTIDYNHHEIHSGSHYFYEVADFDFDDGDSIFFSMCVPDGATKEIHLIFTAQSTGICSVTVTENDSVSGGTSLTPRNNDRNSANTSIAELHFNADYDVIGDTLFQVGWGANGTGPNPGLGGGVGRDDEIILKADTCTSFMFKSGTDNSIFTGRGSWYEHTPKN